VFISRHLKSAAVFGTAILLCSLAWVSRATAQEEIVRTPEEILAASGGTPTVDAIVELFINVSEWDEAHSAVQEASRKALIDLGPVAVPTLLDKWLSSVDVRRRVELDAVIGAIGYPATQYLLPYLDSSDTEPRRHAAYLIGDTSYAKSVEDPALVGPFKQDLAAIEKLGQALAVETDWHVIAQLLGSLGKMRDPSRIDTLASRLTHEEQSVRLAAAIALGRIPDQKVVPHLIDAFNDPVMNVRQAAVLAISTRTVGNLAFEALLGTGVLSPRGEVPRICALESLGRYLQTIGTERTDRAASQRERAFDTMKNVIDSAQSDDMWAVRGFAVNVIGFTCETDAKAYIEALASKEKNPFVIGEINEALDRLAAGLPEPAVE